MDDDILDLKKAIKKLGSNKLSQIVGIRQLEAVDAIVNTPIKESNLVYMLLTRYGSQVLANKSLRNEIINGLSPSKLHFLLTGEHRSLSTVSESDRASLFKSRWIRKSKFAKRLLEIFNLPEKYLPPVPDTVSPTEVVEPERFLYKYQREVKDRLVRKLVKGDSKVLVHMPTGSGKTRTSIEAIADYIRSFSDRGGFFVWLAHSEELCEQSLQTFMDTWKVRGDSPINIYRLWGKYSVPHFLAGGGFIVASLQKVYSMKNSDSNKVFKNIAAVKNNCNLIVVDEAHKSMAPTYKAAIDYLSNMQKTKLIGLTATPGRGNLSVETDNLARYFNKNKITITEDGNDVENPLRYLQKQGFLSKIKRKSISSAIDIDLSSNEKKYLAEYFEIPPTVLKKLSNDNQRNMMIVYEISKLVQEKHSVITFACSVEHAHLISELLLLRDIESRCIDSKTSSEDRKAYIDQYKNNKVSVLVNYGVLSTGFDAPNTSSVVITRPTASIVLYSQMIGRGIRGPKMGGNKECVLIDIHDNLIGFPDENYAFNYFDGAW